MKSSYSAIGDRLILTLWIGGMWFAGFVVAPILFDTLDRSTAGTVAGQVFTVTSYLGIACAIALMLGQFMRTGLAVYRSARFWILVCMLLLILIGQFLIQPMMVDLKAQGLVEGSEIASRFGRLHGISSFLYLVTSLLGLVLVSFGGRTDTETKI
jgi:hypothetical protein